MLKINLVLLLLLVAVTTFAQIPANYYALSEGLSGDNLKAALHNIIKEHKEFPYSNSSTDTWDILKQTDKDTVNSDNVILIYSGWGINAAQEFNNEKGWNREHVWAKSHGGFNTSPGTGTDVHHLRPSDISVNAERGNKDFDNGGNIYVDADGTTECRTDNDSWEARSVVKGDVARMLFYMAVRYEGENGELDLELVDQVNTAALTTSGKGYHGKLSTLLEWHKADPVDSFEIKRNNIIYSFQENRNPFIDHPEFVDKIWGTNTSTSIVHLNALKVYPNPAKGFINVELPENLKGTGIIYSMTGNTVVEFTGIGHFQVKTSSINPGFYNIRIVSNNKVYLSKIIIQD